MQDNNLSIDTKAGWVAVLQHYFVSAWIPNQDVNNQLYTITDSKIMLHQLVIVVLLSLFLLVANRRLQVHCGLALNFKIKWQLSQII